MSCLNTKVIAHRGASFSAPENTMPAFKLALEIGADGIETDVQFTKDRVPVLIHDVSVNRTTNSKGYVKNYTFEELQALDAGTWFHNDFKEAQIISLESFLKWFKDTDLKLHLELKNNRFTYEDLEATVFQLLKKYHLLERSAISTFNAKSVKRMEHIQDEIEVALLLSKHRRKLIPFAKSLGVKALHVEYPMLSDEFVELCKKENMLLRVYTVNDIAHMQQCFSYEVDTIFTDKPDECLKQRNIYQAR